jgi:putative hydrolase of HD superfamily
MTPAAPDTLTDRFAFLQEAARLSHVLRATTLCDGSRRENSGEHSWHVALFALVMADQAGPGVRIDRVIRMLLLHDLVEIDTGDTPIHSANGAAHGGAAVLAAEQAAADRLFGLLPAGQAAEFRALWEEFEAAETPDAVFAKAIDRIQPVLANLAANGGTWGEYQVTRVQLESRVGSKVRAGAPELWAALTPRIDAWFARR